MAVWSIVRLDELRRRQRFDAEYFQPAYLKLERRLNKVRCLTLNSLGFVTDGIHASPDVVDDNGVRYLSAKCVKDNEFLIDDTLHISREQNAANRRTQLREGDLLITTVGTIGNTAVVVPEILPGNIDRHLGLVRIRPDAEVDAFFVATLLNSRVGRFQSRREATGNVQLNLFIEKIKLLKIPLLRTAASISKKTQAAYDLRRVALAKIAEAEQLLVSGLNPRRLDTAPTLFYERNFSDLQAKHRFGAEYFMPCKERALSVLSSQTSRPLGEHFRSVRDLFNSTDADAGDQVRNFDLTDAIDPVLDDRVEPMSANEVGSTKKKLVFGDVVISRLRSYLREIAIVRAGADVPAVGSSEFIVLRRKADSLSKITPTTLLIFLRSLPVQTILRWSQDGSQHPRFTEEDLLAIPVPDKVEGLSPKVDALVDAALQARANASRLLQEAKAQVERQVFGKVN
jgi:type I restriction enzyme S subunit